MLPDRAAGPRVVKSSLDNYLGLYDRIGLKASYSGAEAAEGFGAFKERRSPQWVHPQLRAEAGSKRAGSRRARR